ncbi:prepilin-type N-terminal cleavage/methylation domain-containing protein [Collimonas sp. OK607]|uniref:pilus assembly FimT family protein n=1 Tax=Collimonas sp. OK607 TaxID=1798194 RepID=UPI0008F2F30C|nr:GspH/FimT family pseudopilin [Collimonas sp. OK607]SFB04347.1 prepilin-type N-terminal cleavage/methylation domain-containing protein [Collimonas sp. OK607]
MRMLRSTRRAYAPDSSMASGMTLIEAMITLAIMCILLSLALPSMRSFVIQNRLSAETSRFIAALALVRSEAIQRGRAVLICRRSMPTLPTPYAVRQPPPNMPPATGAPVGW